MRYTDRQLLNLATAAAGTRRDVRLMSPDLRTRKDRAAVLYDRQRLLLFPAFLLISTGGSAAAARTLSPGDPVGFRTYFAVELVQQPMSDEFDGYSFYSDFINLYTIPKLQTGSGVRVSLGFRQRRLAVEAYYATTSHRTLWLDRRDKARHHELGAGVTGYLNPDGVFQPYATAGLLLHFLVAKKGGLDLETELPVRETFGGGLGLRIGGGLGLKITREWALRGEAAYRVAGFRSLAGRDIHTIPASTLVLSTGIVYTFAR